MQIAWAIVIVAFAGTNANLMQWPYQESDHERSDLHCILCLQHHRTTILQGRPGASVSTGNGSYLGIIHSLDGHYRIVYGVLCVREPKTRPA